MQLVYFIQLNITKTPRTVLFIFFWLLCFVVVIDRVFLTFTFYFLRSFGLKLLGQVVIGVDGVASQRRWKLDETGKEPDDTWKSWNFFKDLISYKFL